MDDEEYRRTVIKMRAHADAWFRKHTQSDLIEARRLERIIDKENKRWLDEHAVQKPASEPTQANLFTENDNDEVHQ